MNQRPDETDRLASLLRAIPPPEPPANFLAGARRRYREAIDARHRREISASLASGLLGLGLIAFLLVPAVEPASLVAWLAEAAADVARWMTGAVVVLSLVPLTFWAVAALSFVASTLTLIRLARAPSLPVLK
jgi:hypothetical protein